MKEGLEVIVTVSLVVPLPENGERVHDQAERLRSAIELAAGNAASSIAPGAISLGVSLTLRG